MDTQPGNSFDCCLATRLPLHVYHRKNITKDLGPDIGLGNAALTKVVYLALRLRGEHGGFFLETRWPDRHPRLALINRLPT